MHYGIKLLREIVRKNYNKSIIRDALDGDFVWDVVYLSRFSDSVPFLWRTDGNTTWCLSQEETPTDENSKSFYHVCGECQIDDVNKLYHYDGYEIKEIKNYDDAVKMLKIWCNRP